MPKSSNLLRYSGWNLVSLILPLFVGLVTIPYLLKQIGIERFGVLGIIWALVGYFSLFDFGISKALTKKLSEGRVEHDIHMQRKVFWTAILLMLGLGILGWLALYFLVQFSGGSFIKVSPNIRIEVNHAILLVSSFIPLVIVSAGLRGCLEAYEEFRASSVVRLALGVWMFLAPAVASGLGYSSLSVLAAVIVFGRVVAAIISWKLVADIMQGLGKPAFTKGLVRPLFSYGAWITLSGIIGPLMSYADRFLIGAIVGAAGVAYYTTPQDVATKLLLLPMAINTALFPLLAKELNQAEVGQGKVLQLVTKSMAYALLGVLPFSLLLMAFPFELLKLWLGGEFAAQSALVLQLFSIGILAAAVGVVLIPILFASNKPAIVAKLYLVELPVFIVSTIYLSNHYGIVGAAWAWMLRSVLDTLLIWYFTARVRIEAQSLARPILSLMVASIGFALLISNLDNLFIKILLFMALCGVTLLFGYKKLLRPISCKAVAA
jgi:O-antigen/teichoic acid export membrane protein